MPRTGTNKIRPLDSRIHNRLKRSAFSKQDFLPQDAFEELLTEENIRIELRRARISQDDSLLEFILKRARKVFTILVYSNLVKHAANLQEFCFTDRCLPIEQNGSQVISLTSLSGDDPVLGWFKSWSVEGSSEYSLSDNEGDSNADDLSDSTSSDGDERAIRKFCQDQWLVLSPVFDKSSIMIELHQNCRLPFLSFESRGGGGFSLIHVGEIHPAHQMVLDDGHHIAIKELRDDSPCADKAFDEEIDSLDMARNLNHPNIVKFIAGFKQDGKRYLLFQWVDGGNLRELWEKHNPLLEREESILWALRQIHALSGALEQWHNYHQDSQKNCRHGDLKPENLLRTLQPAPLGILQIADLGLAKVHSLPTHVRTTPSGGFSGTLRYQAPEIVTSVSGKISRSYDMWSMGCILLEFIIWLLYGQAELQRFNLSFSDSFFVCEDGVVRLQDSVQRWIDHISETILSQSSTGCLSRALKELFTFVVGRLLVEDPEIRSEISNGHLVSLPTEDSLATQPVTITLPILPASSCNGPRRAKIAELYSEIHNILLGTSTSYFYDPVFSMDDARRNGPRKPLPGLFETERLGLPHGGQRNRSTGAGQSSTLVFANTNNPYGTVSLSNSWDIITENEFAKKVFRALPCTFTDEIIPKAGTTRALCDRCSSNDKGIFSRQFSVTLHHLEGSRRFCGLCQVLYEHMIASPPEGQETPTYFRVGSSLKRNITGPPLFSIVAGPGFNSIPEDIQRGFPILPKPASDAQIKLLSKWIQECDSNHKCSTESNPGTFQLPSRLIDLGRVGSDENTLQIDCSTTRLDNRYVALSHRWGDPKLHTRFCLLQDNLDFYKRKGIKLNKLPQTFKDAVKITRALKIRYLWIDSLCIIQENGEDWKAECQRMEMVFSCAYLTIAATSASGSTDGFLKPRPLNGPNTRVAHCFASDKNDADGSRFYVCNAIDNFKRDVEEAELSKRGWVYQERALSRRTIHFTDTQVYWECGNGIRCETLTKLFNRKSSFLSDPEFPQSAVKYYKGMRILFFQNIYERYSELNFTMDKDRSVGMAGLERRLLRAYGTTGRYGILHDSSFLGRSLLWQRADSVDSLRRINYDNNQKVPSWSWMAVMGPIKYRFVPFDTVIWNEDTRSPFQNQSTDQIESTQPQPVGPLVAVARDFAQDEKEDMVFDREMSEKQRSDIKCVVVGIQRVDQQTTSQKHYVLLVTLVGEIDGVSQYERVGVATLEKDRISPLASGVDIQIV